MERAYQTQPQDEPLFFVGVEVEKTPAQGQLTLFVVGQQSTQDIIHWASTHSVTHIYLGANKSFAARQGWKETIDQLIDQGYWVTLDHPVWLHYEVTEMLGDLIDDPQLILMISVEVPRAGQLNRNTTVKIDDVDFNSTNPGVWCAPLKSLMSPDNFTDWLEYADDKVIE